jgi:hypothetical protein
LVSWYVWAVSWSGRCSPLTARYLDSLGSPCHVPCTADCGRKGFFGNVFTLVEKDDEDEEPGNNGGDDPVVTPKKPFSTAIGGAWDMVLGRPWSKLPYIAKLGVGWGAVLVLFLGATFGIKQTDSSPYKWRVITDRPAPVLNTSKPKIICMHRPKMIGCARTARRLDDNSQLSVITWLALAASDLLESGIQGRFLRHEPLRRTLT